MSNRTAYPRSSARPIYLATSVLGLLGLAGVIVMLIAMADVPKQSYYLLIAAFGLLTVALAGALAMLLATNTRRPWGIDPNLDPPYSKIRKEEVDSYGTSTEELLRHAIQLPDGNGYGRRQSDDTTVVRRLVSTVERDDRPLPPTRERPAWASEILPPTYREEPRAELPKEPVPPPFEEPRAELPKEPVPPPFTEIPLDQLDLVPALPNANDQKDERVDAGV